MPQPLWLSGADHCITYCNPKFCELLGPGNQHSSLLGKPWHSLIQGYGNSGPCEELLHAIAQGQRATRPVECRDAQGNRRVLQVTLRLLPLSNPPSCMGIAEDVTAQHPLHPMLSAGINCLRQGVSVIEVPAGPADTTPRAHHEAAGERQALLQQLGRLVYANPALEQMSGQSQSELQAGGLASLLDPSSSAADIAALVDALHSRTSCSVKLVCMHKDNRTPCWTSITVTPIHDASAADILAAQQEQQQQPRGNPPTPTPSPLQEACVRSSLRRGKATSISRLSISSCLHEAGGSVSSELNELGSEEGVVGSDAASMDEISTTSSVHTFKGSATASRVGSAPASGLLPSVVQGCAGSSMHGLRRPSAPARGASELLGLHPMPESPPDHEPVFSWLPASSAAAMGALTTAAEHGGTTWSSPITSSSNSGSFVQPPEEGSGSSGPSCTVASAGAYSCMAGTNEVGCHAPQHSSGPVHYLCIHEDITASVSQEMSWQLRDHALSSCSEGITIADPSLPDAPLVYVNDAFLHMTGYSREEVIGRNCRFLQGPDTSREAVATLREAVAAQSKATVELLNYTKDGEPFWNRLSITPMFNAAGELVSYIGVQSDVTELIQRKEEERRLLEAKLAAESATEAKSMFLANMSHELRTPLNGMMATTQLLLDSCLDPEQRDLAETVLESGTSLLGILGDILDFSKLDHGSITLRQEPIFLRSCIESCFEIVAPEASKKGLMLYYTTDEQAMAQPIMADSIRLRQVLTNLLSNAVKFTERGEVHVDVRVEDAHPQAQQQPAPETSTEAAADAADLDAAPCVAFAGLTTAEQPQHASNTQPWRATWQQLSASAEAAAATAAFSMRADISDPGTQPGSFGLAVMTGSPPGVSPLTCPPHKSLSSPAALLESPRSTSSASLGVGAAPSVPASPRYHTTASNADTSSPTETHATVGASDDCGGGPQQWLHIQVRDTGIGIPPDVISTLFQCFKQGSETRARKYGGTGLGLAISKRLSELMQGSVWVESEGKGHGCTFHFCMPADFHPLPCPTDAHSMQPQGQAPSTAGIAMPTPADEYPPMSGSTTTPSSYAMQLTSTESGVLGTSTEQASDRLTTSSSSPAPQSLLGCASEPSVTGTQYEGTTPPMQLPLSEDPDVWSGIPLQAHRGVASYASSTASSLADSSAFSCSGFSSANTMHSQAYSGYSQAYSSYSTILPEDRAALEGRCVLVDMSHPGVAAQIAQSCKQLGMQARVGTACYPSGVDGGAAAAVSVADLRADILVVSTERASAALKAGWKGRPVVAVGPRDLLSPNLWPLVVPCALPVMHARLTTALVKSLVLLRWAPGRRTQGPKLTHQPISPAQIADFKLWRDRAYGSIMLGARDSSPAYTSQRGVAHSQYADSRRPWGSSSQAPHEVVHGFGGGFVRSASFNSARRSLDNSILDRGKLLAGTAQHVAGPVHGGSSGGTASGPHAGIGLSVMPPKRHASRSAITGHALPCAIPENTVPTDEDWQRLDATLSQQQQQQQQLQHGQQHHAAGGLLSSSSGPLLGATQAQAAVPPAPLHILIAEDNKVNQKVVTKVLQSIDSRTEVDIAENGLQALQALERKSYDLILMDIHMPEMDGLEATRRIMATHPPATRPRIIALSADTLQDLHDQCREAGIEEFIVKPFRVQDLRRILQTHGGRSTQVDDAAAAAAAAAAGAAAKAGGAAHGSATVAVRGAAAGGGAAAAPAAAAGNAARAAFAK